MGTNDIGLQATFVRDSYTVHLEGDVEAYYVKESSDPATPQRKDLHHKRQIGKRRYEIYVAPKTGYVAAENALITINGVRYRGSSSYKFKLN